MKGKTNSAVGNCALPAAGQNMYETFSVSQTVPRMQEQLPTPNVTKTPTPNKKQICQVAFFVLASVLLSLIVVALFLIYTKPSSSNSNGAAPPSADKYSQGQTQHATSQAEATQNNQAMENAASCSDLMRSGVQSSGLYTFTYKGTSGFTRYETYCDMTSDGGGWTLVASVHREELMPKCGRHDMWSYYPYKYINNGGGSSTWFSMSSLGNVRTATSADFKSPAYFRQPASDVMLSHVPNDVEVTKVDEKSFLKYRTTNGFLTKYGSTLQSLYSNHAPLKGLNIIGLNEKLLTAIKSNIKASNIFPNWYNYAYDAPPPVSSLLSSHGGHAVAATSSIYDGGRNMFDVGNKVYFRVNDEAFVLMQYDKSYTDSFTYHISSAAIHPFTTLATISNFEGYPNKFTIKVVSHTSSGGRTTYHYLSFAYKNVHVNARAYHVYGSTGKPSTTTLLFFLKANTKWNGVQGSTNFPHPYPFSATNLTYEFSISGKIRNYMMGYMLLSSLDSSYSSNSDMQNLLRKVVDLLDLPEMDIRSFASPPQFITPVKFIKGSLSYPNSKVTPGYLQFQAYDTLGYSYAMCPGVRVDEGEDPSRFCIGSAASTENRQRCGDFSDWESLREHVFVNRSATDGKFVNDLRTTILIFTR